MWTKSRGIYHWQIFAKYTGGIPHKLPLYENICSKKRMYCKYSWHVLFTTDKTYLLVDRWADRAVNKLTNRCAQSSSSHCSLNLEQPEQKIVLLFFFFFFYPWFLLSCFWVAADSFVTFYCAHTSQVWSALHLFFSISSVTHCFSLMQILIHPVFILVFFMLPSIRVLCELNIWFGIAQYNTKMYFYFFFSPSTSACKGGRALTPGSNKRPTLGEKIR